MAMENTAITIHNSRCLVLGLGRCGTTLTRVLLALGAKVTVASRSGADLARAIALGAEPLALANLKTSTNYDLIFNTIPAMVLPRSYLRLLDSNLVIIDIAASPGGTDFAAAEELGDSGHPCLVSAGTGGSQDCRRNFGAYHSSPTRETLRGGTR